MDDLLTWENTYAIAQVLRQQHPGTALDELTLAVVYRWVLDLPEFGDDPALANEPILTRIVQDWYEEENPL
jgi:FeS assembly protein IscX